MSESRSGVPSAPGSPSPRRGRRVRVDGAVAGLFLALGVVLLGAHLESRALVGRSAERVAGGERLTVEQRLTRVVAFVRDSVRVNHSPEEVSPGWVRLYYRLNPLHPGPGSVLRWGTDYRGPCGSKSRVVKAMLKATGTRARLRLLLDESGESVHTVVEALDGGRWIVADPTYAIVFHRRDGRGATADDLAADTVLFHAHVDTIPGYSPAFDYDSHTLFNWEKVPVILPAVRDALTRLLGPERVAEIKRPTLWMWPRLFYALAFLVVGCLLGLLSWRRARRAPPGPR